jgi:adenylate cyclase
MMTSHDKVSQDPEAQPSLLQQVKSIEDEKNNLEILLEIVTEHSTKLENQIHQQNLQLQHYIQQVEKVTAAAIAVKHNAFQPQTLQDVANRDDQLGELAQVFITMVQTIQDREQELRLLNRHLEQLLQAYGRFVPHDYLKFLKKKSIVDVQLGDHISKEMAILFSDIRSFTRLSEKMTPQENFDFINAFLKCVSPEIHQHNGLIIKYLGDGMMAVFPDSVDDAVQAGIAKFQRFRDYNQTRQSKGYAALNIGIGIHVGHVMLGIIGEANRIEGDALSGNVTLAARIEGLTKYYGVSLLVSAEVVQRMANPECYQLRLIDRAIVKGTTEPVTVYEVLDAETEPGRSLKVKTLPLFEQAYQHYAAGELALAQTLFEQIQAVNPEDKTTQLYLERIQQFLAQGIPPQWAGIWMFDQK